MDWLPESMPLRQVEWGKVPLLGESGETSLRAEIGKEGRKSPFPGSFEHRHCLLGVSVNAGVLICLSDQTGGKTLHDLKIRFRHDSSVAVVQVESRFIESILNADVEARHQQPVKPDSMAALLAEVGHEDITNEPDAAQQSKAAGWDQNTPLIIKLVQGLLIEALEKQASDIHLEPESARTVNVRIRQHGIMTTLLVYPLSQHPAVMARVKILAQLDISEKRIPQDGKFHFFTDQRRHEARIATLPTIYGEAAVIRLLGDGHVRTLDEADWHPKALDLVRRVLDQKQGLLLVVGPTGSGKTSTLHSLLKTFAQTGKKLWTVEDPVEVTQPHLQQVQINNKVNLTFPKVLRSLLRADPDIILIGELRDSETAEVALQAAVTGHLVLSTLHTNSAVGAITRLRDLGIKNYQIDDALIGVISQRLVLRRCICTQSKTSFDSPCTLCNGSRGIGRIAVHEVLSLCTNSDDPPSSTITQPQQVGTDSYHSFEDDLHWKRIDMAPSTRH